MSTPARAVVRGSRRKRSVCSATVSPGLVAIAELLTHERDASACGGAGMTAYSPGRCARDIYDAVEALGGDLPAAEPDVIPLLRRLAREPDLLEIGLPRDSNHGAGGSWLYWDGEIALFTAQFEDGVAVPVHNHGTWEIVGVYEGRLDYQAYRRLDDGSVEGYAELEVAEDRILGPGDFSVVPLPPHDIHGF